MKENPSLTPHDDFFKLLMEVNENAAELIQAALPPHIVQKLNLKKLRNIPTSFTDGELGNFQADVVYECVFGDHQPVLITLLFEHKSYIEDFPHLQILKYMLGIWDQQKKNDKVLRPILPILFYHGQNRWQYRTFSSYFEGGNIDPDLLPYFPDFNFWLINLQEKGDQWIREQIDLLNLRIALLLMRNIGSKNLLESLPYLFKGAKELLKTQEGRSNFKEISLYLFRGSRIPNAKIRKAMDSITFLNRPNPEGSIAWHLEKQGEAKGRAKRDTEIVKNMLQMGLDVPRICELTGISADFVESLRD